VGFQPKADLFPSIAAPANVADAGPAMYVETCFRLRVDRIETADTGNVDDAGKTGVLLLLLGVVVVVVVVVVMVPRATASAVKNDEIEELNFE
jgi:hypothetical protein